MRSISPDLTIKRSLSFRKATRKLSRGSFHGLGRQSTSDLNLLDNDGNAVSKT